MTDIQRPVGTGRLKRTMPLAGFTARAAGGRVVAALRAKTGDADAVDRFHQRTAEQYAELLGQSKGVLMKAGQLLSMVDVGALGGGEFSPYQQALTRLQSDAPPMDPVLAVGVVEDGLGMPISAAFAEFDTDPVAAASIGQVHRATLHDGRQVAVKVQYPGVAEAIRHDLANTELLSTVFRFMTSVVGTRPDLREATREMSERISEEIDYRHEAANIAAFGELYRGHPFIRIPEVVPEASSDRVLTMSYLEGADWAAAQQADQDVKNRWGEVISRMVTGSYRHGNLFHADPHPGNYRFFDDGSVGFLDFGCVKVLPELQRGRMIGMLRAALADNRDELRRTMVESGFFEEDSTLTADEAHSWWAAIVHELLAPQPITYTPEAADRAIRSLIDVRASDHPVRRMTVPPDLVFFSRLNLSLNAILATLRCTFDARTMVDDMDGISPPTSNLGKAHTAWVQSRGLPFGLDRHDHP